MPVCIAGMHRSGTSMITNLLRLCGLYLGQEGDLMPADPSNPDGYWENLRFVAVNNMILNELSGAWDRPPAWPRAKASKEILAPATAQATRLVDEFSSHDCWGWKDPRNSLTLPFWRTLIGDLRVVVCVRNPLEVAASLNRRQQLSSALSFDLWVSHNQRILAAVPPARRIITLYDRYFDDPMTEIKRMVEFTEMTASVTDLARCNKAVAATLRHHRFTLRDLHESDIPLDAIALYENLCIEAGHEPALVEHPETSAEAPPYSPINAVDTFMPVGPYNGFLEIADNATIAGWAIDQGQPDVAACVELLEGNRRICVVTADGFRPDLAAAGIGDGRHAFTYPTPASLLDGKPHAISAKISGTDFALRGSPRNLIGGQ